ncbi:MAG TPA: hypothetical protein PLW93_06280, partial [Candidatus Absconditabacterales bacterium]|nr:hypothetical protein [Candidatus Absconditabacterales bacterium]
MVFERELTRSSESHVGTFTADNIKGHDKDVKYKGKLLSQGRFKTRAELGELATPGLGNKQWQVFGRKLSDFAHIVIDYDDSIVGYVDFDKNAHTGAFRFSNKAYTYNTQTYLVQCNSYDDSILESDPNLTAVNPITTTTKPTKPKMQQSDNAYNLHLITCDNMSQASRVAERILPFTIQASSSSAGSAAVPIKYIDKYGNSCKPAHDSFKEFDYSEGDLYYVGVHKLSDEVIKRTGYSYDSTIVISRTRKKAMLNKKTHNVQNIPHLTMTYEQYKSKFESLYYKSEPAPQVTVTQSTTVTPVIKTDSKVNRFDELVSLRDGSEFSKFLNDY